MSLLNSASSVFVAAPPTLHPPTAKPPVGEGTQAPGIELETAATTNAPPGSRAVIYLRVSSKGQVNTDYDPEGISIPAQRLSVTRKAEQLGLNIVAEYVEPGRSATEMTKRIAFQQMLERIRHEKDIDYVIVYKLSRFARNRIDDAVVMADLQKRGVSLISATEQIDDTPVGQLMHGILAAFNEYRSREDGADIAYKMGQKAKNGGTIGRAPIGYLNTIERFEGRDVRSVAVDEQRAPFVKLAFELYAGADKTLGDIVTELTDRGLTTRGTARRLAGPISVQKMHNLLRDRYYLGEVHLKGEHYDGRHPAIISQELFDKVQEIMDARGRAGERRRVHENYLKGTLFCGRCWLEDKQIRRMIVQRSIGKQGNEYWYFFCIGTQDHDCDAPYSNMDRIEVAIEEHYKTIQFRTEFITTVRAAMESALADSEGAQRLLRKQLDDQLIALNTKEENLLDLAADGSLPQAKIRSRLRDIKQQRERLTVELNTVEYDLRGGVAYIDANLRLLENPHDLYMNASDATRRILNQAIFKRIYVVNDEVVGDELNEPLAELLTAQRTRSSLSDRTHQIKEATVTGDSFNQIVLDWLNGIDEDVNSSKPSMVELRRFELLTSSMRTKRATNCAIAPNTAEQRYHLRRGDLLRSGGCWSRYTALRLLDRHKTARPAAAT